VQKNLFLDSWLRACQGIGARAETNAVLDRLMEAYSEPHRKYHTLQHLRECIQLFEKVQALAKNAAEVEMALWFHDAIYKTRRNDNEEQSAYWARTALSDAQVPQAAVDRVSELILVTQHTGIPINTDQKLIVDIDLSILGASTDRFEEYERQIREEYAFVPGWIFRHKRRLILKKFLNRPRLYHTDYFYTTLEEQAHQNLSHAVHSIFHQY